MLRQNVILCSTNVRSVSVLIVQETFQSFKTFDFGSNSLAQHGMISRDCGNIGWTQRNLESKKGRQAGRQAG